MKLIANITAVLVMGALAYAALSALPATSELAAIGFYVVTIGTAGLYCWQESEQIDLSLGQWAAAFLGSWFLSTAVLLVVCWLRNVSPSEALMLPPSFWKVGGNYFYDGPFRWTLWLGPIVTLLAIGSLVRLAVLRLCGAFLTRA